MTSPALRDNLRLALTVAVVNGFATLTGLAFAMYASLAVLSVTVGNYGNTLELGRQRLIGTTIGAIVVFFGYRAWGHLPVLVALPLALLLARLIAGSLRLTVGYSVCCFVVIMGWRPMNNSSTAGFPCACSGPRAPACNSARGCCNCWWMWGRRCATTSKTPPRAIGAAC